MKKEIYKRRFVEKNLGNFSKFSVSKTFGNFKLEEMAIIPGFDMFLQDVKYKGKSVDPDKKSLVESDSWETFKNFLKEAMKTYKKNYEFKTFREIIDFESTSNKIWKGLNNVDKQRILSLADYLDNNSDILN